MNHPGPGYLLPELLIGTVTVVAVALFGLHRAIRRTGLPVQDRRRAFWSGSALLVGWLFAALALSWSGFYQGSPSRVPTLPLGLLIPIAAGVVLFFRSPLLRRIIDAAPQSWIVTIQVYRAEGLIFLILYAGGLLPGAFAWPAGVDDVICVVAAGPGRRHRLYARVARLIWLAPGLESVWDCRSGRGRGDRLFDLAVAAATPGHR